MRKIALFAAVAAYALQPVAALAGTKDFALQGYALPADKPVTITMMRPDVSVGELQAGGLPQPNAEWTDAARTQITNALRAELGDRQIAFVEMEARTDAYRAEQVAEAVKACHARNAAIEEAVAAQAAETGPVDGDPVAAQPEAGPVTTPELEPEDCDNLAVDLPIDAEVKVAEYNALHSAVVASVLAHQYGLGGGKLPTKKESFEYTLGPGTSQLGEVSGANYGLFILTNDQFASDSRKAMQVMGALGCIIGACVLVGGGIHVGYVSLVELETGNIVWFNLLRGSKGDVREEEGARGMVQAILTGMPTRPGEMATTSGEAK